MKASLIPNPVRAVVAEVLAPRHTHTALDTLFLENGAPGEPPTGNKVEKRSAWLHRCNVDPTVDGLAVLGKVLENFMEVDLDGVFEPSVWEAQRNRVHRVLGKHGLSYCTGGHIYGSRHALPTRKLEEIPRSRDLVGVEKEFERAAGSIESDPPAAITAACAVLEALPKVYVEDEQINHPGEQTLKPLFKTVASDLRFDPRSIPDEDLKRIISGLFSLADGIGSLRTHAGSAHGRGRMRYRVDPRHARLAVHSAHTLAVFLIESWEAKRGT